jgi:hypothetical protein
VAAEGTAIARGELFVTTLDALGPHIDLGTETTMARAFATLTGLAVLRRLVCGGICWLIRLAI